MMMMMRINNNYAVRAQTSRQEACSTAASSGRGFDRRNCFRAGQSKHRLTLAGPGARGARAFLLSKKEKGPSGRDLAILPRARARASRRVSRLEARAEDGRCGSLFLGLGWRLVGRPSFRRRFVGLGRRVLRALQVEHPAVGNRRAHNGQTASIGADDAGSAAAAATAFPRRRLSRRRRRCRCRGRRLRLGRWFRIGGFRLGVRHLWRLRLLVSDGDLGLLFGRDLFTLAAREGRIVHHVVELNCAVEHIAEIHRSLLVHHNRALWNWCQTGAKQSAGVLSAFRVRY